MNKYFWLIIFLGIGCEPAATFEDPQPDNIKPISRMPKKLIGQYFCKADSNYLRISKDFIVRESYYIDSIINDTTSYSIKVIPNLYSGSKIVTCYGDTILNLSKSDIIKKYKGSYFINTRYEKSKWEVRRIIPNKNGIKIGLIESKEEIDRLREITGISGDSISTFKLSKQDFKKFIKGNSFTEENEFIKISTSPNKVQKDM